MSPTELQFLRQDIRELLKKVDSLDKRLGIVESSNTTDTPYTGSTEIIPGTVPANSSNTCNCGSIPEEYCTCKLW